MVPAPFCFSPPASPLLRDAIQEDGVSPGDGSDVRKGRCAYQHVDATALASTFYAFSCMPQRRRRAPYVLGSLFIAFAVFFP